MTPDQKKTRLRSQGRARELTSLLIALFSAALFSFPTHLALFDERLNEAEHDSFDSRMMVTNWINQQWVKGPTISPKIQLIGIQTRDYTKYREDFDSRKIYTEALNFLRQMGADTVISPPRSCSCPTTSEQ